MNSKLLQLRPKRYLCPFCGEWHDWPFRSLNSYTESAHPAELECPYHQHEYVGKRMVLYEVCFPYGRYFQYEISPHCNRLEIFNYDKFELSEIIEDENKPIVSLTVDYIIEKPVGDDYCGCCPPYVHCIFKDAEVDQKNFKIQLAFEFCESEYAEYSDKWKKAHDK